LACAGTAPNPAIILAFFVGFVMRDFVYTGCSERFLSQIKNQPMGLA